MPRTAPPLRVLHRLGTIKQRLSALKACPTQIGPIKEQTQRLEERLEKLNRKYPGAV